MKDISVTIRGFSLSDVWKYFIMQENVSVLGNAGSIYKWNARMSVTYIQWFHGAYVPRERHIH